MRFKTKSEQKSRWRGHTTPEAIKVFQGQDASVWNQREGECRSTGKLYAWRDTGQISWTDREFSIDCQKRGGHRRDKELSVICHPNNGIREVLNFWTSHLDDRPFHYNIVVTEASSSGRSDYRPKLSPSFSNCSNPFKKSVFFQLWSVLCDANGVQERSVLWAFRFREKNHHICV